jgi:hypothetical protein
VSGPFPDVPQVLRFTVKQHLEAAKVVNGFYVSYTGTTPSNAVCATLAVDFGDDFNTHLIPHLSVNLVVDEVECIDLTTRTSGSGIGTGSWAGGHTESVLPASSSLLCHWGVPVRYRGGHPRTYLAGLTQDRLTNNQEISGSAQTTFDSDFAAFVSAVEARVESGTSLHSFVLVRVNHDPTPPTLVGTFEISAGGVQQRVCTQRRRLGKLV